MALAPGGTLALARALALADAVASTCTRLMPLLLPGYQGRVAVLGYYVLTWRSVALRPEKNHTIKRCKARKALCIH